MADSNCSFVTVVSGLPRSGTSMMMQMLAAGGVPVLIDQIRKSDEDNLKGYLEFEPVKASQRDVSWVGDAMGKAVKVVYMLLKHLPADHQYRVLFMRRDLVEVVDSQRTMLIRRGENGAAVTNHEMAAIFARQLESTNRWLESQPHFRVIEMHHQEVISDPMSQAQRVREFLGLPMDVAAMAAAVDPSLHHQRHRSTNPA